MICKNFFAKYAISHEQIRVILDKRVITRKAF